jgi:hypothetical protein
LPNCTFCNAKKFPSETANFCCCNGNVVLHQNKLPDILIELFSADSEEALCFRKYIRTYNNMFAFTSFGVKYDKNLCKNTNGVYTFRVQGQVYHFINHLIPSNSNGLFLQLYFHDTEHELHNRMATSSKFTESIVIKLMEMMKQNPYACFFKSLKKVPDLDSYQIILKSRFDGDQRVYNKPTVSQVAALWVDSNDNGDASNRHIRVHTRDGQSHSIRYYYGCYDPLQYPLLFPYGEVGWHEGIKKQHLGNPKKRRRRAKNLNIDPSFDPTKAANVGELLEMEENGMI